MENKINQLLSSMLLEKNLTFLLGAGASAPFFSSLGNLENLLLHPEVSLDEINLIKCIFYDKTISSNELLLSYLQNGELEDNCINYQILDILYMFECGFSILLILKAMDQISDLYLKDDK